MLAGQGTDPECTPFPPTCLCNTQNNTLSLSLRASYRSVRWLWGATWAMWSFLRHQDPWCGVVSGFWSPARKGVLGTNIYNLGACCCRVPSVTSLPVLSSHLGMFPIFSRIFVDVYIPCHCGHRLRTCFLQRPCDIPQGWPLAVLNCCLNSLLNLCSRFLWMSVFKLILSWVCFPGRMSLRFLLYVHACM